MTPDEIRSELADCKVVNRYLTDVNGDRFWVFGMASDTLLLRRIVDGVMRPLCTRTFDEVASIEPADKVQDSETIEAQQRRQEDDARGMRLRRAVESSDVRIENEELIKALPEVDFSKPVQVYRNLNKPGCKFSVRQGGKVRGYVDRIALRDVKFKHATPKQLEEVRTGARQVCQWVTGVIDVLESVTFCEPALNPKCRVQCDPKTADGFMINGKRIDESVSVIVCKSGLFAAN